MRSIEAIRQDFPILSKQIHGKSLVYLDNGATTQMPECVMDYWKEHYMYENANVHRGIHYLSERSTIAMEEARKTVAEFIHSPSEEQIIFTSGATDSLNMIAEGYARNNLKPGKKVIVTELEHHSNFVPWQMTAKKTGAEFVVIPLNLKDGKLDLEVLQRELDTDTVFLSVTATSNVTGQSLPLYQIIEMAHAHQVPVCVDASQAMRHGVMDISSLDCEFLAFSGHKMMGPAGIGVLYGKREYLEQMEPVRYGGGMVDLVSNEQATWGGIPTRFEAGTPNYSGAIALGKAMQYLNEQGIAELAAWEEQLTRHLEERLKQIEFVTIMAEHEKKSSVVSLAINGVHPYDMASFLDKFGVAVRSGHHCAQPLLRKLGYEALLRFSPAFYNTIDEIDYACDSLEKTIDMLKKWS